MCGIAGFFKPGGFSTAAAKEVVLAMTDRIRQRGPDDEGSWIDPDAGIALGHRRLSVIDLSISGHQPMISASGRYVIVFNGEIYNHKAIRESLEANTEPPTWRGHSDTETVLEAIERWGVQESLTKFTGMFAIALWDRESKTLTLARDRMGEKPLYYGWQNDALLFASELKAIQVHPSFKADVDRGVLRNYLCDGYIRAPNTIYQGINKLMPGCFLQIDCTGARIENETVVPYWSLHEVATRGASNPFRGSQKEATDELHRLLRQSIELQRVADVPLGAFLSGGIDSSTVVALMQETGGRATKTFTIGFSEANYNEANHAKAVADYLGTDHTELLVTPLEAMDAVTLLPSIYDEPFGDSSAIPTYLVAALARESVTVSLSGDGGDELFGGYDRYRHTDSIWNSMHRIPFVFRKGAASVLAHGARIFAGATKRQRAERIAGYLRAGNIQDLYSRQMLQRLDCEQLIIGDNTSIRSADYLAVPDFPDSGISTMMFQDTLSYLPDDILAKVDRASMAVSLETRVPLLDHRLVEFAWSLPLELKRRGGSDKGILKDITYRYLPKSIMDRPKAGFGVPVSDWIRGPLREWAEDLLTEERLQADGYFDAGLVRRQWQQHLDRPVQGDESSWQLLMFQAWLKENTGSHASHSVARL